MPTGYTSSIKDGISFKKFALNCARTFGACVTLRDEPTSTPIPEKFEPSNHYSEKIKEAENRINELQCMAENEAEIEAKKEFKSSVVHRTEQINEHNELRKKYEDMLQKIKDWQSPSLDHTKFKEFMIQQIESSIEFDCDTEYYEKMEIELLSGKDWISKELNTACKDLAYYQKENIQEMTRVNDRNRWIKQLRESL